MTQTNKSLTHEEAAILELEKKYMSLITKEFYSKNFREDLNSMKKYIQNNYNFLAINYDKKNKVEIGLERLIRKHTYSSGNFNIIRPYFSPLSSDVAFETDDAIINIDSKTIDEIGNSSDILYFHFEANQCSFKNNGLGSGTYSINGKTINYNGVEVKTTLPSIDPETEKPILTYVIRVIYRDNGVGFNFSKRSTNFSITCLPNGKLSSLFDNDLVLNFKTYEYHKETGSYKPVFLTEDIKYNFGYDFIKNLNIYIPFTYAYANLKTKWGLFDGNDLWVPVKRTGKNYSKKGFYLEKIKSGHTARIKYNDLILRYDKNSEVWKGHLDYKIEN